MGISAATGPLVVFGSGTAPSDYNGQQAPSLFFQSLGLLDPRPVATYQPGQADTSPVCGWAGVAGGYLLLADVAPTALANTAIAAAQSPSGAGALTLVTSSGSGVTVGQSVVRMDNNATDTGLLALDGAGGRLSFGALATVQLWDPAKLIGRAVQARTAGSGAGTVTLTVNGYDVYGQPLSENITYSGSSNTRVNGKKAFKYINSCTVNGAGTNIGVGTTDIFGFPLRSDALLFYTRLWWNAAEITATTGYVAADTTTATATTGDVRGTYAVQSASDGSKRLQIAMIIPPSNLGTTAGLLGVTDFTNI